MNTKYIHLTTLITLFVSYFSTAQTTSFSNNVILKNDTVITLHLGGLNDGYNSQKVHEYIAGGFPDYKRISTIEPLDSIIISNNDTNNILKLQIITDENIFSE